MAEYKMTPDIREKEKVVGGIFTITQTIFLGMGIIVGGGLGLLLWQLTGQFVIGIVGLFIGALPFIPFAFVTIRELGDMELFRYFVIRRRFNQSQRVYVNLNQKKRDAYMPKVQKKEHTGIIKQIYDLFQI